MLTEPSINDLMKNKNIDSRYSLIVATAKRARQLTDGAPRLTDNVDSDKAVTVAVEEIFENKITFVRTKDGVK